MRPSLSIVPTETRTSRALRLRRVGRGDNKYQRARLSLTSLREIRISCFRLSCKIRARLHASSEVAGTDESFFDDDRHNKAVTDLYHEKAGLLDGEDDSEVDLVSYACPQLGSNAEVLKLNEYSGDLAIVDADEVS